MARSIDDVIADIDLPKPQGIENGGEDLASYARRIAVIGAHHGAAWALTNRPPATVVQYVQVEQDAEAEPTHAEGSLDLTGSGSTDQS